MHGLKLLHTSDWRDYAFYLSGMKYFELSGFTEMHEYMTFLFFLTHAVKLNINISILKTFDLNKS